MRIYYHKLWRLLAAKGMSKTELADAAGISSRTLAKLSKNEVVTTETLARICGALHCDISDIAEYSGHANSSSVYDAYLQTDAIVAESEFWIMKEFFFQSRQYRVYESREKASKSTIIHCREDGAIEWEQLYPFGGISNPSRVRHIVCKPIFDQSVITIAVIKGKPGSFMGLYEDQFCSSKHTESNKGIFVMSTAAFKCFIPPVK